MYPDGQEFREARLHKKTYIYSLIGTNGFNRTSSYKTHTELGKDNRLRFFPGNHDWANAELIEQQPWESYHLAALGEKIDEDYEKGYFRKLVSTLEENPQVELALQAEKDIEKLCSQFYLKYTYHSGDRNDQPKRTAKGAELAEPYTSIPHGEFLKRLGQKCK